MELSEAQQDQLRLLPAVDHLLELISQSEYFSSNIPQKVFVPIIRQYIDEKRQLILKNSAASLSPFTEKQIKNELIQRIAAHLQPRLVSVVNATGVVVHTNLGRSLLSREAVENVVLISSGYSNLEFDLDEGKRGSRYSHIEEILCEITGAESALAVNNNAGAVLLCLDTLAKGREAIVSRGELVEIGGSFRIPDVMARSGAILKEVGSTNRTHLRDYENAISPETGLLLKVHTSNYAVVGFTSAVSLSEMVMLGNREKIPVMEDLGSGTFIDFSQFGMAKEPTVQESVAAGVDVITFSGDKLLGGPQAGMIIGKKKILDQIKMNPLTRALRIDKMTLAALESTLALYRNPAKAIQDIPTLRMLSSSKKEIEHRAIQCKAAVDNLKIPGLSVELVDLVSRVGGGALPLQELPSKGLRAVSSCLSTAALEKRLRAASPAVICRIEADRLMMDFRTVQDDDIQPIAQAFRKILKEEERETFSSSPA